MRCTSARACNWLMYKVLLSGLLFALWLVSPSQAGDPPAGSSLDEVYRATCEQTGTPGAVLALLRKGSEPDLLAYGTGNLAAGSPLAVDEVLPIGSVTKLFTAVVVLQLFAEGRLGLDDTVAVYFPELPHAAGITVRQLLNHSSGIYDYAELQQDVPLPLVALALAYSWDPYQIVSGALGHELYFTPGTGFHYSNSNYILLGLIIEQVTGNQMEEEYRQRIIEPLELKHTYLITGDRRPEVHGYLLENGALRDSTMLENPTLAWTAGGLASNTTDLLTFARALFEGDLLTPKARQEMLITVQRPQFGGYGLGLMDVDAEGVQLLGHGGWTLAFRSGLWYLPEEGIYLANLTNLATCDIWTINEAVLRWAMANPD